MYCSGAEDSKRLTKSVYFADIPNNQEDHSKVLLTPPRRGNKDSDKKLKSTSTVLLGLKIVIGLVFFAIVLTSSVFSKLTLVSLTERLRNVTMHIQNESDSELPTDAMVVVYNDQKADLLVEEAVSIYWQLLVILIVPNLLTFLRCLFFGFLGKTRKNFPWPKGKAILLVSILNYNFFSMHLIIFIGCDKASSRNVE